MIDKKTLGLAIVISWALTLVTVLLISNFAPSLTQPFTQQFTESNSVKVVRFEKQEVLNVSSKSDFAPSGAPNVLYINFTWTPSNQKKNSLLAIVLDFEYRCDDFSPTFWENRTGVHWLFMSSIHINKHVSYTSNIEKIARNQSQWNQQWSTEWETATYQTAINYEQNNPINNNQNRYPIQLFFGHSNIVSTYIRNVNLMLLVVDG